jgi:hypothetical protein
MPRRSSSRLDVLPAAKIRLMPGRGPTYRIDPIEPSQIGARFVALLDRLEPVLAQSDVDALRAMVAAGDHAAAFTRLDAITNDGTITVDTAILVELVLLGQAIGEDRP